MMNTLRMILPFLIVVLVLSSAGCLQEQENPAVNDSPATVNETTLARYGAMLMLLDRVASETQGALSTLDHTASDAATALETTGLSGIDTDAALGGIVAVQPYVLTAITYDRNGTVVAGAPEEGHSLVGLDLSGQEVVSEMIVHRQPLMSDLFPLAEGGYAAVIEYPVFSPDGDFAGAISVAFLPGELIAPISDSASMGTPYSIMVTQADGRILYDTGTREPGEENSNQTLFAEFPEGLEYTRQYSGNGSGHAVFSSPSDRSGRVIDREAFWTTVGLHGTEWRIMVIGGV